MSKTTEQPDTTDVQAALDRRAAYTREHHGEGATPTYSELQEQRASLLAALRDSITRNKQLEQTNASLLAACNRATAWLERLHEQTGFNGKVQTAIDQARTAIAKAEGRAS